MHSASAFVVLCAQLVFALGFRVVCGVLLLRYQLVCNVPFASEMWLLAVSSRLGDCRRCPLSFSCAYAEVGIDLAKVI